MMSSGKKARLLDHPENLLVSRLPSLLNEEFQGPSHGTSSVADSCLRNSSGVILRNSQKLNAGNFRPNRPYGV
jgi:hypothetical protein